MRRIPKTVETFSAMINQPASRAGNYGIMKQSGGRVWSTAPYQVNESTRRRMTHLQGNHRHKGGRLKRYKRRRPKRRRR